jgi:hypothetical protein
MTTTTTIEKKSLRVGKYVDTNHVDTVIRNYKQERWVHNSERLGKEDSMSAWYSIEELEEFIEKVKDHGGNGIKFYFAAYSHDYVDVPEYAGRQTIVMVASKGKRSATRIDNKDIYVSTVKGSTILAYNSGQLCPPFCYPGSADNEDSWGGIGTTLIDRGDNGMVIV